LIIVQGPYATINTDGGDDIAAGDTIINDADKVVNSVAAGNASTYVPLAIATAADVNDDNTVAGYIIAPHNGW
jgi:hypothetical protein